MVIRLLIAAILLFARPALADQPFMEAMFDPADPYVQQETVLTLRLYRHSSFQTGYFFDREGPDFVIEPLGEDDPVTVERYGRPMQMIQRRYLLFPQRSGRLRLETPAFSGRQIFVAGPTIDMEVRPRPSGSGDGWWMPARAVSLAREWRLPDRELRPGDHLERIVSLLADGLSGAQLSPLPLTANDDWEIRRLGVDVGDEIRDGAIIGWRRERHLLVPRRQGDLSLPPVEVVWWNTADDRAERAVLAGENLEVVEGPTPEPVEEKRLPVFSSPSPAAIGGSPMADWWKTPLVVLAVFLSAWLARWRWGGELSRRVRERLALAAIAKAARENDAAAARMAVIAWAGLRWGERPTGLGRIGRWIGDPALSRAFARLDAAIYGHGQGDWDGRGFRVEVLPILSRLSRPGGDDSAIPPLNP